ncbi:cell division protein FtsQ/DivIB [Moraxella oculi]|uniref:Cell division protein FtsQ/DivIB n=1 Tax=Moraxella oculi TaxID=2940516 RepID=A0ABW8U648_9GAMM
MKTHQKSTKKHLSKACSLSILGIFLFVVIGVFGIRAVHYSPAKPIVIDHHNLTQSQASSLQAVAVSIGDVQFFLADLPSIHHRIAQLSWVGDVSVRRDWQQGVVVSVVPRRAVANFGSQHLLDANGQVFVPADEHELMDPSLVRLYGSHSKDADKIMKQMRQINEWFSPLGIKAWDVTLTARQTWLIRFDNGLRVIVDHENTDQKLYTLALLLQNSLAKELPKIHSVDLRYKNGFAVAWRESH